MFLTHCLDFRSDSKIVFCTIIYGHHPLKNGAWEISLSFGEGLFSERNMLVLGSRVSSNHSFAPPGHPVDENPSNPVPVGVFFNLTPAPWPVAKVSKHHWAASRYLTPNQCSNNHGPVTPSEEPWDSSKKKKLLRPGFWRKGNQSRKSIRLSTNGLSTTCSCFFNWNVFKTLVIFHEILTC